MLQCCQTMQLPLQVKPCSLDHKTGSHQPYCCGRAHWCQSGEEAAGSLELARWVGHSLHSWMWAGHSPNSQRWEGHGHDSHRGGRTLSGLTEVGGALS